MLYTIACVYISIPVTRLIQFKLQVLILPQNVFFFFFSISIWVGVRITCTAILCQKKREELNKFEPGPFQQVCYSMLISPEVDSASLN
jgi:hypothetical protein